MYQALYRKYRPKSFRDVVGQEHITETLRRQVESGRTSHAYLFVGTRGTGKTTCAKILSRALNCEHPINGDPCNECASCRGIESGGILDVVEIDAASNNGVDNIRAIRDEAVYTPASVKKRVYIIDEVHMLSTSAFNALLKILEEPPEHLVFILATTELNKVPATILSRCQHFSFRRIMPEDIAARLRFVASQEGLALTDGAAALLSRLADGSMRDALSLLDQCAGSGTVDEGTVMEAVGLVGPTNTAELWRALMCGDITSALELFENIFYGGADPNSVLTGLLSMLRDMMMVRVAPKGSTRFLTGALSADQLAGMSGEVPSERLLAASETLQAAVDSMRDSRDKRTKAELCLIRLAGQLDGSCARAEEPAQPAASARTDVQPAAEPKREARAESPVKKERPIPPPWEDIPEDVPSGLGSAAEPEREHVENPKTDDAGQDAWWDETLKRCSSQIDENTFRFLSDKANLAPSLTGGRLTLYARNGFVLGMVDTPAIKGLMAREASTVLGRNVTVDMAVGIPERNTQDAGHDRLNDLAKFGDIVRYK